MNYDESFVTRLKQALEAGVLLTAKYSVLLIVLYFALQFFNGILAGSQNGTQAAIYLNQMIEKGYLPKAGPDGQIPPKIQEAK